MVKKETWEALPMNLHELHQCIQSARAEFMEGVKSPVFNVWNLEFIIELWQRPKKAGSRTLLKQSGLVEAMELPGQPVVAPRVRIARARQFFRVLRAIVDKVERNLSDEELRLIETTLAQWERICGRRLTPA